MPIFKRDDMDRRPGSANGLEVCEIMESKHGTQRLRMGELTIAPNSRVPRHTHTNTEEAMILLEGTLDAVVGSQRLTLGPGDAVLAPPGSVHGFVNRYESPARLLFVFPEHNPDRIQASVEGATSGFPSEQGLSGYSSPQDRPLDSSS